MLPPFSPFFLLSYLLEKRARYQIHLAVAFLMIVISSLTACGRSRNGFVFSSNLSTVYSFVMPEMSRLHMPPSFFLPVPWFVSQHCFFPVCFRFPFSCLVIGFLASSCLQFLTIRTHSQRLHLASDHIQLHTMATTCILYIDLDPSLIILG